MQFFKQKSIESHSYNFDECTIEFIPFSAESKDSSQSILRNLISWPRNFYRRIHNTYLLIRHAELREPIAKNMCPFRLLNRFSTLFFDMKIAAKPNIMKSILRQFRKDPKDGIFSDRENVQVFLPLLKDLYPGEEVTCDDFLLTCNKEYVHYYRHAILRFIGPQNIKNHESELQKIVEETLEIWGEANPEEKMNATELSFVFTTNVISRLLLGHPGPLKVYKEIAYAIDYLNKYVMKRTWRQKISDEDKATYNKSLEIIRAAIEVALNSTQKPVLGSLVDTLREEKKMTELQIKTTLLLMYLGGSETAASILNYLLWQLGQHSHYQEKIFQELLKIQGTLSEKANKSESLDHLFIESIRLFTPAYVMGRQPAKDLICNVRNKEGNIVFSEKISKNQGLLCGATFAARDPLVYEKPDEFNPDRFQYSSKTLAWLPFGDGRHSCPGQWLAKNEMIVFVAGLVQKYHIQSFPEKEIGQKGYMTLKPTEDVWVHLRRR